VLEGQTNPLQGEPGWASGETLTRVVGALLARLPDALTPYPPQQ